jgi:hypothetical protein
MPHLRQELDAARREYQTVRYAGDLAHQLLPARLRLRSLAIFGSLGASGIAAAALIGALLLRPLALPGSSRLGGQLAVGQARHITTDLKWVLPPLPNLPANVMVQSRPATDAPTGWRLPSWDDLHLPDFSQSSEHA